MLIVGAGGFARHCLQVMFDNSFDVEKNQFFDNVTRNVPDFIYGRYKIITSLEAAKTYFENQSPEFILGLGGPHNRKKMADQLQKQGGLLTSLISEKATIAHFNVMLGPGLNVMENSIIEVDTIVGQGSLINMYALLSHDVQIGSYCEISPGARLLGRVKVGDYCQIGSNAVILPDVKVGSYVKVGAGAVVTKDVPDNSVVVGVPARPLIIPSEKKFENS